MRIVLIALGLTLLGGEALAVVYVNPMKALSGYTYFNKPGSTLANHNSDLRDCLSIALQIRAPGSVVGGIAGAVIQGVQTDAFKRDNVERCMLVRGWRVVRAEPAEGAALSRQDPATIEARLADWVGSAEPAGQVVRKFGEADGSDVKVEGKRSLSIAAFRDNGLYADPTFRQEVWTGKGFKYAAKPLKPEQMAQIPADRAVFVLELKGSKQDDINMFSFTRMAANANEFAGEKPGEATPWFSTPLPRTAFKGVQGKSTMQVVMSVEPGWWAVTSAPFASTCLMAPAFQAKAGDVLFLGSFDLDDPLRPRLDVGPARAALASRRDLADRVRPAEWTNGLSWTCRALFIGGYAIEGAPYIERR